MVDISKVLLTSVVFVLINSCEKDEVSSEINSDFEVAFQIEKLNSSSNYTSEVKSANHKSTSRWWSQWADNKTVTLSSEVLFDLELENGETIEFGIWFLKTDENKDFVNLVKGQTLIDGQLQYYEDWNYNSITQETENFYKGFDEVRISIDNTIISTKIAYEDIEVTSVEQVMVNGEEKNLITIKFKGESLGAYSGKNSAYFRISNGVFKGILR